MRRTALLLALPLLLLPAACGDDDGGEVAADGAADGATDGADGAGGAAGGEGTIAVRLEPTDAIFIEGFEVGLRFDAPATGEEIARQRWSDFVASLPDAEAGGIDVFYDSVYEQAVPAGVVRVGADVSIGMGPGPEPPDLDATSLPCELDVEVAAGETVTVQVAFDDSTGDCLQVVS